MKKLVLVWLIGVSAAGVGSAAAFGRIGRAQSGARDAELTRDLASRDAAVRQTAAEEIARLADLRQRKLVEGYRLQEGNARVKLALDWALYRLGKNESLFNVVRELGSTERGEQARRYLLQIEGPRSLYLFLGQTDDKVKLHLIGVLAVIGDAESAEQLRALSSAPEQKIADAAQAAIATIEARLARPADETISRPRRSGRKSENETPRR